MIPGDKTKNGQPNRVPLSPLALKLIDEAIELTGGSPWLFPSPNGDGPIDAHAPTRALARARDAIGLEDFRIHDLRRTAATRMAELGISPHTISMILNHVSARQGTITSKVYVQYSYDAEKREALRVWASKIEFDYLCREPNKSRCCKASVDGPEVTFPSRRADTNVAGFVLALLFARSARWGQRLRVLRFRLWYRPECERRRLPIEGKFGAAEQHNASSITGHRRYGFQRRCLALHLQAARKSNRLVGLREGKVPRGAILRLHWPGDQGNVTSVKAKDFIGISQYTRAVRDTDQGEFKGFKLS